MERMVGEKSLAVLVGKCRHCRHCRHWSATATSAPPELEASSRERERRPTMPPIPPTYRHRRRQGGYHPRVVEDPDVLNSTLLYAITDGLAVKVGKSDGHPVMRLRTLQTGNPRELQLLAYTAGVPESVMHRRLERWRLR